jgi:hypothetical protein
MNHRLHIPRRVSKPSAARKDEQVSWFLASFQKRLALPLFMAAVHEIASRQSKRVVYDKKVTHFHTPHPFVDDLRLGSREE